MLIYARISDVGYIKNSLLLPIRKNNCQASIHIIIRGEGDRKYLFLIKTSRTLKVIGVNQMATSVKASGLSSCVLGLSTAFPLFKKSIHLLYIYNLV